MKNNFKKNCSKLLVFMQMTSLSPVYAMDNIEDDLENQSKLESPVLSDGELDSISESNDILDTAIEEASELNLNENSISDENSVAEDFVKAENSVTENNITENEINIDKNIDVNNIVEETENEIVLDDNANLKSLGFYNTNSGSLTEEFSPNKNEYVALIKGNSTTFRLGNNSISVDSALSKMDIYFNDELIFDDVKGTTDKTYTLARGITNTLKIIVTAENGDRNIYNVKFEREGSRDTSLSHLGFLWGNAYIAENLNPDIKEYTAVVKEGITQLSFNDGVDSQRICVKDPYATMDIYLNDELIFENVTKTSNKPFVLVKGMKNVMKVVVTTDMGVQSTYTVNFERDSYDDTSLSHLGFLWNDAYLLDKLEVDKREYTVMVKEGITKLSFNDGVDSQRICVKDPYATMDIYLNDELIFENVTKTSNKPFTLAKGMKNVMKIIVTADSGVKSTYTINFERESYDDTSLSYLGFLWNNATITEPLSPDKREYTAIVKGNITSLSFNDGADAQRICVKDPYATMDVYLNGKLLFENVTKTSNKPFALERGIKNVMEIVVTADSGVKSTYTVNFEREGYEDTSLSYLGFLWNNATITESLSPDKREYTAIVKGNITSLSFNDGADAQRICVKDPYATMDVYLNDKLLFENVTKTSNKPFALERGIKNVMKIVVTADSGVKTTYTVNFEREGYEDTSLSYLGFLWNNATITEPLSSDKREYTAIVKGNITSLSFNDGADAQKICAKDPYATMDVYLNGELLFENVNKTYNKQFTLAKGIKNVMEIVVTADSGVKTTYTVNFEREGYEDTSLSYLGFLWNNATITEPLSSDKREYTAIVKGNITSLSFNDGADAQRICVKDPYATMDVYLNDKLLFENVTKTSNKPFALERGIKNVMKIVVTADSGAQSIYTVNFEREGYDDTSLSYLGFLWSNAYITEKLEPNKTEYTAVVKPGITTLSFNDGADAQKICAKDPYATMDIYFNDELIFENVNKTYNKSFTLGNGVKNVMKIVVTADSGVKTTYTVNFEREGFDDTSLSYLGFLWNNATISEKLEPNKREYTAIVKGNITSLSFNDGADAQRICVKDPYATMDVYLNGELLFENVTKTSNKPFTLVKGIKNVMEIVVTAENGKSDTYVVNFEREGYDDTSLSYLGFLWNNATISESLSPDKREYTAIVKQGLTTLSFNDGADAQKICVKDPYATMDVYLNDKLLFENVTKTSNRPFALEKGIKNVMKIVVTADSGVKDTYTVVFERELDSNTNIKNLTINKDSLSLVDDKYRKVMSSWKDVSVSKVTLEDDWANYRMLLNGEKEIALNEKFDLEVGNNRLDIEVTSNDGTKKVYPVVFERTDNINPDLNVSFNDDNWTNEDILVNISATDDSGIEYIELPDGNKVHSDKVDFYINTNDVYIFKVYDKFLNETIQTIEVKHIDKENPELNIKATNTELTNNEVDIVIESLDNVGVEYIELPNGEKVYESNFKYTVHEDGTYIFKIKDLAGNETVKSITLNNIDSTNPILAAQLSEEDWSNEELTLSIFAMSDKGIKYIELPDGTKVEDNIAEYGIRENGVYMVATESLGGNITTEKVVVENIDTEVPKIKLNFSADDWTNSDSKVEIIGEDNIGIDYVRLPNGQTVSESNYTYFIEDNGVYEFTVVDLAGNECSETIEINNIDKELPTMDLDVSTTEITNSSVDIIVEAFDNIAIKYIETPDGEIVDSNNFKYTVYKDGTYSFKVVDHVGNEIVKSISIDNIDNVNPVLEAELSNNELTNEGIILNINALSNKGIKYIELPDGSKVEGNFAEYSIEENGIYTISTESLGGNITTEKIVVENIDKELPTLDLKPSTKDWTNEDISISVLGNDNVGVDYVILPNGEKVYESTYDYLIDSNGKYEFTAVDLVGNEYTKSIEINNIDKEIPVVENHDNLISVMSDIITLDISNILTPSGIYKIILPNGEEVINPPKNIITFRANKNGVYKFIVVDGAGNSLDIDVPVDTIKEYVEDETNLSISVDELDVNNLDDEININNSVDDEINIDSYNDPNLNKDETYSSKDVSDDMDNVSEDINNIDKLNKNNVTIVGAISVVLAGLVYYVFKRKK